MERVAITGADGFIGSRIVELLAAEGICEVRPFNHSRHNLMDPESLKILLRGCRWVIHLAGVSNPLSPDVYKINVDGTDNLLRAIADTKPAPVLIFASSFAVYKVPKKGDLVDEKYPVEPRNRYGESKLAAERLIAACSRKDGIKALILRISNVYGPGILPGRHSVVANFIDALARGQEIKITGDGTQTRDFIYIDDVARAFVSTLEESRNFDILNICSGKETSINSLLNLLQRYTGNEGKTAYVPGNEVGGFWRGDNAEARKILGWLPRFSLEDGLELTVKEGCYENRNSVAQLS